MHIVHLDWQFLGNVREMPRILPPSPTKIQIDIGRQLLLCVNGDTFGVRGSTVDMATIPWPRDCQHHK